MCSSFTPACVIGFERRSMTSLKEFTMPQKSLTSRPRMTSASADHGAVRSVWFSG